MSSKCLTRDEVERVGEESGGIGVLHTCGGFYGCRNAADGSWQGPLVGYAKRIKDEATGLEVQMVGKKYYNFAKVEEQPAALTWFANQLANKIGLHLSFTVGLPNLIVAAPMGGITLGVLVACRLLVTRYSFSEKEVLEASSEGKREKSRLVLARHEIPMYSKALLVEDVTNNFSTTQELVELLAEEECRVVGIACALNRSGKGDWNGIPVIAVVNAPTEQWREDDPIIQAYLARDGEIVRKPKKDWGKLVAAMEQFGVATT